MTESRDARRTGFSERKSEHEYVPNRYDQGLISPRFEDRERQVGYRRTEHKPGNFNDHGFTSPSGRIGQLLFYMTASLRTFRHIIQTWVFALDLHMVLAYR